MRAGRYSPYFNRMAGIDQQNNAFLNREQFETKWNEEFSKLKVPFEPAPSEDDKAGTRQYDFIMYHTLLKYTYKKDTFEELIKQDPKKYIETLEPLYNLSFLDEKRKLTTFKTNIEKM